MQSQYETRRYIWRNIGAIKGVKNTYAVGNKSGTQRGSIGVNTEVALHMPYKRRRYIWRSIGVPTEVERQML